MRAHRVVVYSTLSSTCDRIHFVAVPQANRIDKQVCRVFCCFPPTSWAVVPGYA